MLMTPAGMSVCSAMSRPSSVAFHGVSGAGLSTMVLPVASAWPTLLMITSNGKFQGVMAPTTPTGSRTMRRCVERCRGGLVASGRSSHRVLVDELGRVAQGVLERDVELWPVGEHPRAADLQDQLLAQLLLLGLEAVLQLLEAVLAERVVGRPVGLVERPAGGDDGLVHVGRRAVGDLAEDLLGRRVDVVERCARCRLDELAVDQHPRFRMHHGILLAPLDFPWMPGHLGVPDGRNVPEIDVVVKKVYRPPDRPRPSAAGARGRVGQGNPGDKEHHDGSRARFRDRHRRRRRAGISHRAPAGRPRHGRGGVRPRCRSRRRPGRGAR